MRFKLSEFGIGKHEAVLLVMVVLLIGLLALIYLRTTTEEPSEFREYVHPIDYERISEFFGVPPNLFQVEKAMVNPHQGLQAQGFFVYQVSFQRDALTRTIRDTPFERVGGSSTEIRHPEESPFSLLNIDTSDLKVTYVKRGERGLLGYFYCGEAIDNRVSMLLLIFPTAE